MGPPFTIALRQIMLSFLKSKFEKKKTADFAVDTFSDGQVRSKIWLCEILEELYKNQRLSLSPLNITVLAGWAGLLPQLLFVRNQLPIRSIVSYDLDAQATRLAHILNNTWCIEGRFSAHTADINKDNFLEEDANLWINTSCEHFEGHGWWNNIPNHGLVVLQGCNMEHSEHFHLFSSPQNLRQTFEPWGEILFEDQLDFRYEAFSFSRYMVIGRKG